MLYHVEYLLKYGLSDFDEMGTRELLSHLQQVRISVQTNYKVEEIDKLYNIKAKITTILEFREHIPNKIEAKVIRQQKAKQNKGLKGNKKRKS
jgi:hypothetical protein